jgi:hypothetical protein
VPSLVVIVVMGSPPLLLLGKDPLAPWVTAPADEGGFTAAAITRLAPPSRTRRRDALGLACGFCLVIASLLILFNIEWLCQEL